MKCLFILLVSSLFFVACSGPSPTVDIGAVQTAAAESVFATQTASVPAATNTPKTTATPRATVTPQDTDTPEPTETPEIAAQIPARGKFKHSYKITEVYDRFKKQTVVSLEPNYQRAVNAHPGELGVVYAYDGDKPQVPSAVNVAFLSTHDDWFYLNCHSLAFILDGGDPMRVETEHKGDVFDGGVTETVITLMPTSDFLALVNAKKIEGQLCNDEFTLSAAQMEALRDVASRMQP